MKLKITVAQNVINIIFVVYVLIIKYALNVFITLSYIGIVHAHQVDM